MKRITIKRRLLTLFLYMTLMPCIIIMAVIPSYMQSYEIRQANRYMVSLAESYSTTLDIYLDELDRLSLLAQIDDDVLTALKLVNKEDYETMSDRIKLMTNRALRSGFSFYLQTTRADITNVILIPVRQKEVYISSKSGVLECVEGYDFSTQEWFTEAINANGKAVFLGPHKQDYIKAGQSENVFTVSRAVIDTDKQKILGVVCACADATILKEVVAEVALVEEGTLVAILDSKDEFIYGDEKIEGQNILKLLQQETVKIDGKKYTVIREVSGKNWTLISLISHRTLYKKVMFFYILGCILAIMSLMGMGSVYFGYTQKITRPFLEIIRVMHQVQENNLKARCKIETNDEIADIEKELNLMIQKLDELVIREYQAKLSQRNAEYETLQAQVQPHFLYNTLGVFVGLNRMGKVEELEDAVFSLRDLMRYTLSNRKFVTLEEEISFIRKYLKLQKIRFMDKIEEKIHIDSETAALKIPRLLLQPLVENAVIHGIEGVTHSCILKILAETRIDAGGTYVVICIEDNGAGFEIEKTKFDGSVGINNVENRLRLYFPTAEFRMESMKGIGTKVFIRINKGDVKDEDNIG